MNMRYRNLLVALALPVMMLAATNTLKAQQDTTVPQNNVVMNAYTYTPVLYQRGTSSANMRLFPNPASGATNIYINSIKGEDNGQVVIYNTNGTPVYKNIIKTGNNSVDLGNFSDGMYIIKVFTRDRFVYTYKLMVQK
ncbi:T9SS type A sorting domain-containing protein [Ilyomonas limi]|uniref:T9SS type A sorting domain-containing protein n=2 Tax=Ilyomonas limi TaxID=2575867 RepID=A0A4U3L166_9BACT|nr:T9SS type A sorting domain-containing protein [Ilyomonas limi]